MTPALGPPRRLGVYAVASVALGLLSAAGAGLLQNIEHVGQTPAQSLIQTATIVLVGALVWRLYFARTASVSLLAAAFIGVVANAASGAVSAMVIVSTGPWESATAPILGLVFGAILGTFTSVVALPFVLYAHAVKRAPVVTTFERMLFVSAIPLTVLGAWTAWGQALLAPGHGYDGALALGAATLAFVIVIVRLALRARWLAAVRAGRAKGWEIVPASAVDRHLPAFGDGGNGVLTYRGDATGAPFRAGAGPIDRVARLDRTASTAISGLVVTILASAIGAAASVALQLNFATSRAEHAAHASLPERREPTRVDGLGASSQVSVGTNAACAVGQDGTMRCWGNLAGELLGSHRWYGQRAPAERAQLGRVASVMVGEGTICALREIGVSRPLCWTNDYGASPQPKEVGPPGVVALTQGRDFILALTREGRVWRWDWTPTHAADAQPGTVIDPTPMLLDELEGIVQIGTSDRTSCALDRAGTVTCFGWTRGDDPDLVNDARLLPPARVEGLPGPADRVVLGVHETWARVTDASGHHAWWSWRDKPSLDTEAGKSEELAAGDDFTCGLAADGSVTCWGRGPVVGRSSHGLEGLQHASNVVMMPAGSTVELRASKSTVCARGKDVWCWGDF